MSYNGIGLKSAKGSSTSGFIQRNSADSKINSRDESKGKQFFKRKLNKKYNEKVEKQRKVSELNIDSNLIEHENKRLMEIKIMEYQDQLENDDNLSDEKIQELVNSYRNKINKKNYFNKNHREFKADLAYNKVINPFKNDRKYDDDDDINTNIANTNKNADVVGNSKEIKLKEENKKDTDSNRVLSK